MLALKQAIADAELKFTDIDGLIVNRIPDYQRFCEIAGLDPAYVSITPGQGRFSGICIETAAALIRSGAARGLRLSMATMAAPRATVTAVPGRHLWQWRWRSVVPLWNDVARGVSRADGAPTHGALRHEKRTFWHSRQDVPRPRRAQSGCGHA